MKNNYPFSSLKAISLLILMVISSSHALAEELDVQRDSYIRSGSYAGDNFGSATQLVVKNEGDSSSNTRESWLAFDISSLTGNVAEAKLKVYLTQVNGNTTHYVYEAESSWSEGSLTWNNQPTSYSTAIDSASFVDTDDNQWVEYDVTALVADLVALSEDEVGFLIAAGDNTYSVYHSREASNAPELIITMSSPASTLYPTHDSQVRAGSNANTNYGDSTSIEVKNEGSSSNNTREGWLQFDVSAISGTISNATLRVYLLQSNGNTTHSLYSGGDNWTESNITWNNQPSSGSLLDSIALTNSDDQVWIEYDVTNFIASEVAQSQTTASFNIVANNSVYTRYNSSESAQSPELLIETSSSGGSTVYDNYNDLQTALDNAQPGDVIEFTGTIYGMLQTKTSGTSSLPITVKGTGNATIYGPGISSSDYGVLCEHDWYAFENFTISNTRKGFVAQYGAENGIIRNVTIDTVGDEAFKFRWNTRYWLVEDCVARNTGNRTGSYGEGYYVGNADNNWIDSSTPDTSGYITFLNCHAEDLINDGFDIKEGSSHVKIIGCTVDFTNGQPAGSAAQGDSGIYLRADNIQVINCEIIGQSNGGAAVKLQRENNASDSNAYGSNYEIYGMTISQTSGGSAMLDVKNQAAVRDSTYLYSNYTLNGGNVYVSGSATAVSSSPGNFTEMTWSGTGGSTYLP